MRYICPECEELFDHCCLCPHCTEVDEAGDPILPGVEVEIYMGDVDGYFDN